MKCELGDSVEEILMGDGHPFSVMTRVGTALRQAGRAEMVEEYRSEATKCSYEELINISKKILQEVGYAHGSSEEERDV